MKEDPVKITEKLVSLKSYGGADEPFAYIKELLESAGADVQVVESEGVKNIHATIGKGTAEIGFNGHYDTVPPGDDWARDPLQPTIKEGRLYGLGSTDMKGGLGAMMSAFLEMAELDPDIKVVLQAVGDEEMRGLHGTKVLVEKGLYARRMFIGEPSGDNIANEHKSVLSIKATMLGKSAHGSRVYAGENAILKMANALERMSDEKVLYLTCKDEDEVLAVSTCNVGNISGGKAANIVPAECSAELDIRTPREKDPQEVIDYLEGIFDRIEIEYRSNGMYTPPDNEFVQTTVEEASKVFDRKVPLACALGACDGRFFSNHDIATVKGGPCGFDEKGERMLHRKDEFVPVDKVYKWTEAYKGIIRKYLAEVG